MPRCCAESGELASSRIRPKSGSSSISCGAKSRMTRHYRGTSSPSRGLATDSAVRRFVRYQENRMSDQRPNPDELLARVQEQETRQQFGRLKIFFGASAGVGKTYAMLEAARERLAAGVDVLVGYVETHGRADT